MDSVRGFFHDWQLVLLIIHVGVTVAMIVVILLQRSEGGGLGMASRSDALFSVRGQTNVLSRMTAIFAGIFFFLSMLMAWSVSEPGSRSSRSFMDNAVTPGAPAPAGGPTAPGTTPPAAPGAPSAPTR
jgi:preprotein translocase subunit SecG